MPLASRRLPAWYAFTVIFQDGFGTSLFMKPAEFRKIIAAPPSTTRAIGLDAHKAEDIARGRRIIYGLVKRSNRQEQYSGGMLGLYLSWNYPGALVPELVWQTLEEHGKACLTLAMDRKLDMRPTIVGSDYRDPFDAIRGVATATTSAKGTA
jgi:hypothetical protein